MRARAADMTPDDAKIVSAIAFVIFRAESRGFSITQYEIVKTLFLADRAHLNEYGRPVTYDNYVAMSHGPVPSRSYDILKGRAIGLTLKWQTRDSEKSQNARDYYGAPISGYEEILSPSEMDALKDALATIMSLSFGQIRRLTHQDPAYVDAWGLDESEAAPMNYALLFDEPDLERAEVVKCLSERRAS